MVIQFEPLRTRQLRMDADRRRASIEAVQSRYTMWLAGEMALSQLCDTAGDALDRYAADALNTFVCGPAIDRRPAAGAWAVEQYHAGITAVGSAIRDTITDPSARHAVAQTLQERVLRAELHLRQVLACQSASATGR